MSPPSIWKLPPKHSHFAETRSISLMQAAGTRIPLIERKGYLRSPIRNEVEHSAKKILAECSTRWPSAQYFRSIIQPNYHFFPSPPQKRVKERGAGWARPRPTGTTLF